MKPRREGRLTVAARMVKAWALLGARVTASSVVALLTLHACGAARSQGPDAPDTAISEASVQSAERGEGSEAKVAPAPQSLLAEGGVRSLQRALNAHGVACPVDGRFDGTTQAAVLQFQRREGLAATSMPDLATLEQLGLDAAALYR